LQWRLVRLLHLGRFALLLLLLHCGTLILLLLHLGSLALLLLRRPLMLLLLHSGRLLLLLHSRCLMLLLLLPLALLLLLLHCGTLILLLPWALLSLHWLSLALHVLRVSLVARLYLFRHANVVIGGKRVADSHAGWAAMVNVGKLSPVAAGSVLILELRLHRRSVLFVTSRQLRGSGTDLQSA